MTVKKFKASPLPNPSGQYSQEYVRQLIRVIELYFGQVDNFLLVLSTPPAGTTANRPTSSLQVGQYYFDTTLGHPIWYDGTDWVDATGSIV
jgi:hypothetical protein